MAQFLNPFLQKLLGGGPGQIPDDLTSGNLLKMMQARQNPFANPGAMLGASLLAAGGQNKNFGTVLGQGILNAQKMNQGNSQQRLANMLALAKLRQGEDLLGVKKAAANLNASVPFKDKDSAWLYIAKMRTQGGPKNLTERNNLIAAENYVTQGEKWVPGVGLVPFNRNLPKFASPGQTAGQPAQPGRTALNPGFPTQTAPPVTQQANPNVAGQPNVLVQAPKFSPADVSTMRQSLQKVQQMNKLLTSMDKIIQKDPSSTGVLGKGRQYGGGVLGQLGVLLEAGGFNKAGPALRQYGYDIGKNPVQIQAIKSGLVGLTAFIIQNGGVDKRISEGDARRAAAQIEQGLLTGSPDLVREGVKILRQQIGWIQQGLEKNLNAGPSAVQPQKQPGVKVDQNLINKIMRGK